MNKNKKEQIIIKHYYYNHIIHKNYLNINILKKKLMNYNNINNQQIKIKLNIEKIIKII
jgi:hypothetical protein